MFNRRKPSQLSLEDQLIAATANADLVHASATRNLEWSHRAQLRLARYGRIVGAIGAGVQLPAGSIQLIEHPAQAGLENIAVGAVLGAMALKAHKDIQKLESTPPEELLYLPPDIDKIE